jgi:hypothetical protein
VDLRVVHEPTQRPGPFATAYIDASHDTGGEILLARPGSAGTEPVPEGA